MSIENVQYELRQLRQEIAQLKAQTEQNGAGRKTIDDVPGVRIPKWYRVDVDFNENVTTVGKGSVEIEPDGPFVATQVQVYWRVSALASDGVTAQTGDGLTLPTTIFANARLLTDAAATAASWDRSIPVTTVINNIPEFQYQIQTFSNGRFWTGQQKMPAASFYGFGSSPLYLATEGWVNPSDRIVVYAEPVIATPVKGSVIMVFHGYQILDRFAKLPETLGSR